MHGIVHQAGKVSACKADSAAGRGAWGGVRAGGTLRESTEQQLPRSVSAQRTAQLPRGDRTGEGGADRGPAATRGERWGACERRIFWGLTSQCTQPAACSATSASAICSGQGVHRLRTASGGVSLWAHVARRVVS